jgi:tungstate transport system ATP-binding protein
MNSVLYEFKKVKKVYEGRAVLDLDTLCLEKGKIIGLLGPNGAGKTTLLEIAAFVSRPTTGEVWFDRKKVNYSKRILTQLRRKIVLVQQQAILFTAAVSKNVVFPLKIRNTPKARRERIVDELLALVGMTAFKNASAHKLSAGETQRVAIAQALACSPEVILLDEPIANVDIENRIAIEGIMRRINEEERISIIFTTHDMIQASRLADETVVLFHGKVARSMHENIFNGRIETDREGHRYCALPNGFQLKVHTEKTGSVRISIDPGRIRIHKRLPGNASMEEHAFQGKIVQLTDQDSHIRAIIDAEIPLAVLIPKEVFNSLDMSIGENVWFTCPVESVAVEHEGKMDTGEYQFP